MTRFKVEKNRNYTVIYNEMLFDKNISLKAKGLFATIMSLPDDWDLTVAGLAKLMKEGQKSIYSAVKELCQFGYCIKTIKRKDHKIIKHEFTFIESPKLYKKVDNQSKNILHAEKVQVEKVQVENGTQLSTDSLNTQNKKIKPYTGTKSEILIPDDFFDYKQFLDSEEAAGRLRYPRNDLPPEQYEYSEGVEFDWLIKFRCKTIKNGFVISENCRLYEKMQESFHDQIYVRDSLSNFKEAYGDIEWDNPQELLSYIWKWLKKEYEGDYVDED